MKTYANTLRAIGALVTALILTACGNGGSLSLEGAPRQVATQGSPFVGLNLGGQAMVVQQGQTPTTGIHGWVAVQAVSAKTVTNVPSGVTGAINQVQGGVQ